MLSHGSRLQHFGSWRRLFKNCAGSYKKWVYENNDINIQPSVYFLTISLIYKHEERVANDVLGEGGQNNFWIPTDPRKV